MSDFGEKQITHLRKSFNDVEIANFIADKAGVSHDEALTYVHSFPVADTLSPPPTMMETVKKGVGKAIDFGNTISPSPVSHFANAFKKNPDAEMPLPGKLGFAAKRVKDDFAEQLPTMGGLGAAALTGGMSVPLQAGSAAAASSLLSYGRDIVQGKPMNPQKAAIEGGMSLAGDAVVGAGKGLFRGGKFAADFMGDKFGILTFGKKKLRVKQGKIIADVTEHAKQFARDLGGEAPKTGVMPIGDVLNKKVDWDHVYKKSNKLLNASVKRAKGNQFFAVPTFQKEFDSLVEMRYGKHFKWYKGVRDDTAALNKTISWLGFDPSSKEGRALTAIYEDKEVSAGQVSTVLKRIWKTYREDPPRVLQAKEKLKSMLADDIDFWANGYTKAIAQGDKTYARTLKWFERNKAAAKLIENYKAASGQYYQNQPEKALVNLFNARPEEVLEIKKFVQRSKGGVGAWETAKLSFIQKMYDDAMSLGDFKEKIFDVFELARNLKKNEELIKTTMPEIWPTLMKEMDYYTSMAPKFRKIHVDNGFGLLEAWGVLDDRAKKIIGNWSKWMDTAADAGGRPETGRAVVQMAGRPVVFDEEGQVNGRFRY